MRSFIFKTVSAILVFIVLQNCKINTFEEGILPTGTGLSTKEYPLDITRKEGFSGSFKIEKIADGTILSEVTVNGMVPGNRYFGKVTYSNASDQSSTRDFADLGEVNQQTRKGLYNLKINYSNEPLLFDSLLVANAMVRILEVEPGSNTPNEVLRGDIGSNLINQDTSGFRFIEVAQSNISGTLKIRQRQNGNFLMTAKLSGLTGSQSLKLNYYKGNYETGNFKIKQNLGNYTVSNTGGVTFGFPIDAQTFAVFDTLQGFLGLEAENSIADTIRLASICNFGGNKSSGNEIRYPIYGRNDSVLVGTVLFQEIGAIGSPVRLTFTPISFPNTAEHYLSLHRGTFLDPIDPVFRKKVSNTFPSVFQSVNSGNGGFLTFNELLTFNGNIRITEDTLGFSNVSGEADLGSNMVDRTDSIIVKLDQVSPENPGSNGLLIFRPRKNGKVIVLYKLREGSLNGSAADNRIEIKEGSFPVGFDPYVGTESRFRIKFIGGSPGEPVRNLLDLQTGLEQPGIWQDLKSLKNQGGAYIEWNFTEEYAYPISRGSF